MANYFTIDYESTANTSPSNVELNYGSPYSGGLTVHVSLYAGAGFTATHYKMWGLELVQGEGIVTASGAEWIPFSIERTARLARHNNPQTAYVKFKNASETETETFESNEVTFSFVEPIINSSVTWKTDFEALDFESAVYNSVERASSNIEVQFHKGHLDQLAWSGRNFTGLSIGTDTITVEPSSQIGQIIGLDATNYVTITKVFATDDVPFVTVDYGEGVYTLSTYDQDVKTTLSGSNVGRISNISWSSVTKTLSFDVYKFSTYGFATIQKIEFTESSRSAAYVGDTATLYVYVQDTNGEPVENAPVTASGVTGNVGTFQEAMPVTTNSLGIAEFNLDITSAGSMTIGASVDNFSASTNLVVTGVDPVLNASRSLLTQYEQIRRTGTFSDTISGVNDQAIAEPSTSTVSGSSDSVLEHDMNVLRTLIRQIKGTSDWFSEVPTYSNPKVTGTDKDTTLNNIAGNTLDAKTILIAVSENNSGAGYSLTPGDEGFLFDTTLRYADLINTMGLPIFTSTTNSGSYYDEGGLDRVVEIDLIDMATGAEFKSTSTSGIVFAKFHDGADFSGSGNGTDVYVKFYTADGEYTTVSGDPSSIMMVYPYRKTLADMEEYEWERTDFVSSWEGDSVIVDKFVDLWSYTGAADGVTDPAWTSISGSPITNATTSLFAGFDALNTEIGNLTFTENNYITDGESITSILDALDMGIYDVSQTVAGGVDQKYVVSVAQDYAAGDSYMLPVGVSYTPSSGGVNMDVYLDGQLLTASTGVNGINEDEDYAETSPTTIKFHFDVYQYSNLIFKVRN